MNARDSADPPTSVVAADTVAEPVGVVQAERDISLEVNGKSVSGEVEVRTSLADYLRGAGYFGVRVGCEQGVCGACTVLLDGRPVRSCLVLAVQADRRAVRTVEGLASDASQSDLQLAFSQERALQCGFCTPGFLMLSVALLRDHPSATDDDVLEAVSSDICRCTGYHGIVRAICRVRDERAAVDEGSSARGGEQRA